MNAPVKLEDGIKQINIPIDAVIMPKKSKAGTFPLLKQSPPATLRIQTSAGKRKRLRLRNCEERTAHKCSSFFSSVVILTVDILAMKRLKE